MKIILAGGGTGGHFFPLTALAQNLKEKDINILILGRRHSWEKQYCHKVNFEFKGISTGKRTGKFSLQTVLAVLKLGQGFFEALKIIKGYAPEGIVGFGGYVSVPVLLAGFFSRVPLLIHEQNVFPGLTTRVFASLAREITLGFSEASGYFSKRNRKKIFITGCPLRLKTLSKRTDNLGPGFFGLEEGRATLLVMGGSQGAHRLNNLVLESGKIWRKNNFPIQIIHLTGEKNYSAVKALYDKSGIKAFISSFWDNMGEIYSIADLAVVRGGAGTLAELTAWGIPSIIVPYPYASEGHQELNAKFLVGEGAAQIFSEKSLTPSLLTEAVTSLIENKEKFKQMRKSSKKLGRRNGTALLSGRVIHLTKTSKRRK